MTKMPEFVYLVTVDGEWPVSAIADDHPSTASRVEKEVARRTKGASPVLPARAHVWRARLADLTEVDLVPSQAVDPQLRERT